MASAASGSALRHLRDLFGGGTATGLSDGQLLARYSGSRDEVAFEALVVRHGPMVLATCRAVLRNEHDVEDAFQTAFLVLARKARSIRGGEALGGWLHRVAYRAAVQAGIEAKKRRRKEAEASAMVPLIAARPGLETAHDLSHVLNEEIDRLPARHRMPVVLCDLEGMTYAQAAEQLRWTEPTLRCRLARARQRLKARLTRRGFSTPAVSALLLPKESLTAVPPALLRSTVLAATGGPASAGTALLTQTLLRKMLMTKIKLATSAALAALALASAGVLVLAAANHRPEEPKPAAQPEAATATRAPQQPAAEKPVETIEVKGRVVAPDGRPVAGANVSAAYLDQDTNPWPKATTGPGGRFSIRVPKPRVDPATEGYMAALPWFVASAPGFGVGWCDRASRPDRPDEQVVTLVEEGPPIEGRIVDLEGRAVAGASVQASRIWYDAKRNIAGWIAKARNGAAANLWQGLESLPLSASIPRSRRVPGSEWLVSIATTTASDGRFQLTGIGRDRIAELIVSGPGIATTQVYAFSRPEPEIRTVDRGMMRHEPFIVHAPRFELALTPARRIEGTFRDTDSGKPIAGLELQAAVFDDHSLIAAPGIETTTDDKGRYRLDGLTKAAAYRLFITTAKGLPYTNGTLKVPAASPGMEPIVFDVALKRGVFVRGKVVDKLTGRPIRGTANYFTFGDNPNLRDYPWFRSSYPQYAGFDDEGRYEIVALPGRGLIAIREESDHYRPASGYEKIAGFDAKYGFKTLPQMLPASAQTAVAEIVVDPKAESMTLDLQADPGKTVPIEVVGPDGSPIGDTKVKGRAELYQSGAVPQPSSSFEVYAVDASSPRRVIVMHEGRKLIGSVLLTGHETGPVTIKLEPWGSVAGRIIDDEGRPRKGMFIQSPTGSTNKHPETHDIVPGSDWNNGVRVGDDGRFMIEGLVPGLKYSATSRTGFEVPGDLFVDITVASGEAKDLGDLKVQPPKKTQED